MQNRELIAEIAVIVWNRRHRKGKTLPLIVRMTLIDTDLKAIRELWLLFCPDVSLFLRFVRFSVFQGFDLQFRRSLAILAFLAIRSKGNLPSPQRFGFIKPLVVALEGNV